MKLAQEERDRRTKGLDLFLGGRGTYRYLNKRLNEFLSGSWQSAVPGRIIRLEVSPKKYEVWALCEEKRYFRYFNTQDEAEALRILKNLPEMPYIEAGHLKPSQKRDWSI